MRSEYFLVLACIVAFPLLRAGDRNLPFRGRVRAVLFSVLVPSVFFWVWDVYATAAGHWQFNPQFVLGTEIAGLPIEEWLFFPVVGFVSLFTWESVKYFTRR